MARADTAILRDSYRPAIYRFVLRNSDLAQRARGEQSGHMEETAKRL